MTHLLVEEARINLDTPYGSFDTHLYVRNGVVAKDAPPYPEHHLALTVGDVTSQPNPLVRINSKCFLNETFADLECDCAQQLYRAMELIQAEGGVILYLSQEGKDVGLVNKMKAIQLCQRTGIDMHDAFIELGFRPDERDYAIAAEMLDHLGIDGAVRLLTNNPHKVSQLESYGFQVERVPFQMPVTEHNRRSLTYKKNKQGHILDL